MKCAQRIARNPLVLGLAAVLAVPAVSWALPGDCGPTVMIPEVLIGSQTEGEDAAGVVVVDKRRQLVLRYIFDMEWREKNRWPCSTGKAVGPKQNEGDQKTPEGLYFITRQVMHRYLSDTYGSRALVLDFPNRIDSRLGRTGSNIWLHGTNKPLRRRDSNGCVVMRNADIDELAGLIQLQRTPVIIVRQLEWWPQTEAAEFAAVVLNLLEGWHHIVLGDHYGRFRDQYADDVVPSPEWWRTWSELRSDYSVDRSALKSEMRNVAMYRHQDVIMLLFDHFLGAGRVRVPVGRRRLSLRIVHGRIRIIEDRYHDNFEHANGGEEPLFSAWRRLWQYRHSVDSSPGKAGLEDHDT